jgi:arabinose-5-phosphate isomerase
MRPANIKAVPSALQHMDDDLAAARRVFDFAGEAIKSLSAGLDSEFTRAVDLLFAVKGRVVVSGIGKSGHVGRKIAATLASTGTPAHFVHPAEASHGDLGAIARQDALLMLSWSGESAELSDLITYSKRFRIPLIAMANNPQSTLLRAADVALAMPRVREACPMGMAPTTSTTLMLVLGDALAVALMERRRFSADDYRNFHPGGALGRALIRVCDLMHGPAELPIADENASLRVAMEAMQKCRFGCVGLVDKKGGLTGIITDGDLRRHWDRDLRAAKAADVMTRNPKTTLSDRLAAEALAFMNDNQITQLFVLDAKAKSKTKKPVGILHIHDCLRAGLR